MASTYTDLGTELMTTGENAGNWGTKTNVNLQILEEAVRGYVAISANSDQTLSLTDGSTGDSIRNAVIAFTGTLTANRTITVPALEKWWIMDNQTAGAYTLTVKVSGQTGVTWGTSDKGTKILYGNGTDVVDTNVGGGVGAYDLNGNTLTLDADADTDITADTDDQIDIKVGGTDRVRITTSAIAPSSSDGVALGTSSLEFSDLFLADSAVIKFGDDQDTTLTHTDGTGLTLNSTNKLCFQDTGTYIHSNADGDLDFVSDGTAVDSINIESAGGITLDAGTAGSGVVYEDDGTEMARLYNSSSDVILETKVSDKDFSIKGNDGGSAITALSLDMSAAGAATFNDKVIATELDISGDMDIDGTSNLDNTDIDGTLAVDGTTISLDATTSLNIDNSNTSNGITIGTATSGVPISIGHTTSETTVNDNLTVTGDLTVNGTTTTVNSTTVTIDDPIFTLGGDTAPGSDDNKDRGIEFRYHDGSSARIGFFGYDDSATGFTFLTAATNSSEVFSGTAAKIIAGELDISGNMDIDGTSNLDAVDIDGAVQIDATVTVGVDDTGYDVKFFGATSGSYMLWDESTDDLILAGAAKLYLYDAGGGEYLSSSGSALTIASGGTAWELPTSDGSANQLLKTDGSGNLDWTTVSGTITALNNQSANRLTTIGSTTTELDGEANLTFDGTDLLVGGAGKVQLRDTGLYVASNADGDLDIVSDGTAVDSINIESAGGITLDAGTAGSGIIYEDDGTEMLRVHNSSSDVIVESKVSDKDIIFKVNDGGSATEVARFDGDVSALLLASGKKLMIGAAEEYISGDGTDISIEVGSGGDINIGSGIGLTFGDDGEKIEGDGTDLTIASSAKINLTATSDVHIPNNVGVVFGGDSEKIEGDGTDLTISANNLTIDCAADLILDAGGDDFNFKASGTEILRITNSSSDVIIKPIVDAKDIIFQQRDGTEVARIEDNATFNIVTDKLAINGTAVTATAAELNLLDGGTSVGSSITLADADGIVVNDGGSMKTIPASDLKTYNPGGTSWQSVVTSNTTMVSGRGYFVNTTSAAITMTLPSSPSLGDTVTIIDYAGTFDTNNLTVGRNSQPIMGEAADLTVAVERSAFTLVYVDSTNGWLLTDK